MVASKTVVAFINGLAVGYSGGDHHFRAVARVWAQQLVVQVPHSFPTVEWRTPSEFVEPPTQVRCPVLRTLSRRRAFLPVLYSARLVASSLWALRRREPCFVVATSHYPYDVLPALVVHRARSRTVYWHHHVAAPPSYFAGYQRATRLWERVLLRIVRRGFVNVITVSNETREWLISSGVPMAAVCLSANAAELTAADAQFQRQDSPAQRPTLPYGLFLGRHSREKGADILPLIIRCLLEAEDDCAFVVAGQDGPETFRLRAALEPWIRSGRVLMTGFVSDGRRDALLRGARVVVVPSSREGWSLVLEEARLAGVPAVAFALPALLDAHPDGVVFVAPNNVRQFCDEVLHAFRGGREAYGEVYARSWYDIAIHELRYMRGDIDSNYFGLQ